MRVVIRGREGGLTLATSRLKLFVLRNAGMSLLASFRQLQIAESPRY